MIYYSYTIKYNSTIQREQRAGGGHGGSEPQNIIPKEASYKRPHT